jgi:hypothetical protein
VLSTDHVATDTLSEGSPTSRGRKLDVTIAYTFRSSCERTEMASAFDFRPNGISELLFAVFAPLIRRDVRKSSRRSRRCARAEDSSRRAQSRSCIESEDDLVRFLVAPMSEPTPLAHAKKTALRQYTNRRSVVARSGSVKRTGCLQQQELL